MAASGGAVQEARWKVGERESRQPITEAHTDEDAFAGLYHGNR